MLRCSNLLTSKKQTLTLNIMAANLVGLLLHKVVPPLLNLFLMMQLVQGK